MLKIVSGGAELASSIDDLRNLDLIAEGTNGLESKLQAIDMNLDELRANAREASADEVAEFQDAVDELDKTLTDLSGDISPENLSQVTAAVQNVSDAAKGVSETLRNCPR